MSKGIEVAKAYCTIIPSMEGAQQEITTELTGASVAAAATAGDKSGKKLGEGLGKGLSSVGGALTKGITVPVTAAATASIAAWKGVDAAMDTITTKTGASGAALEDMQNRAKNIATTIPASFQEAGDAIGEVNTRFGLTGDNLETLSGQFIKFAQINGQDVSGSVDNVSKVLAAFGMDASQASGYLDALNVVGQKTGVDVGTLAQQVSANAAQFQQMGLSAADATNLLGQMSMAGLDSSTAMMGMKTAMKSAAADGVDLNTKLSQFKDTMSSNASESDKLAAAYELFGTRAGGAIYNAVSQGTLDLTNFNGSLTDFSGSVSTTFDETQDPLDQFTVTMNSVKEAGADLVDALGPTIQTVLTKLTDIIKKVTDAWNSLTPAQQDNIVKFALVAAAIGPVVSAIGKGITAFNSIKEAVTGLSTVLKLASAGPIVLIGAAIAALVILIITHLDEIKAAFGKIKEFITTTINAIKTTVTTVWNAIKTAVMTVVNGIKTGVQTAFNAVKSTVTNIFNGIKSVATRVWNGIKTAIITPINAARTAVEKVITGIKKLFSGLKLELPKLKLPHFKASGGEPPWGLLGKGSMPKLSVEWYAKAAERGAIFDSPQLIGVGDAAQPEALLGVNTLKNMMAEANRPNINVQMSIYASDGMNTKELAERVADELQFRVDRESRAFA